MKKFARTLKELRTARKITQEKIAEDLGISRSAIGMYETGEREPDLEMTERIADYFGVEVDILIGRQPLPETLDRWDSQHNPNDVLADKVKKIEETLQGAKVAFYDGAFDGLDDDDMSMLVEMAKYLRAKKRKDK